jgi:hypothetical protein
MGCRYGSVQGLDDGELADPDELERQVIMEEFGPVLALPVRRRKCSVFVNDDAPVDWGAFGTVDFERSMPKFDKARYKAEKLREQLKDVMIRFEIAKERLPLAKYQVLNCLRMGVIGLEHIEDDDMRGLARLYLRARRLRRQVRQLEEASWRRRRAVARAVVGE